MNFPVADISSPRGKMTDNQSLRFSTLPFEKTFDTRKDHHKAMLWHP